jgi:hypothetical protein
MDSGNIRYETEKNSVYYRSHAKNLSAGGLIYGANPGPLGRVRRIRCEYIGDHCYPRRSMWGALIYRLYCGLHIWLEAPPY